MGLFDGLLGGGAGSADDPYADILTPAQRNQMQVQGLLAMAGAFAQAGMPSRLPVPFGSALGSAAAALGTGQEAGMKTAIENALAAQKVRDLRNMAEYRKKVLGDIDPTSPLGRAIDAINNPGGTAAPAAPAAPSSAGATPSPGTYATPGASSAAPAAAGPLMMDRSLLYPEPAAAGVGLLGPGDDTGLAGPMGKGVGLLSPGPAAASQVALSQDAAAAEVARLDAEYAAKNPNASPAAKASMHAENIIKVNPPERGGSSTAPAEPDPGAGGDGWGPTFAQTASGVVPARAGGQTYWTPAGLDALQPTEGRYDQIHYPSGYTREGVKSSASGGLGFIDPTWRQFASQAGVDLAKWPRAYMAPPEVQRAVAAITPVGHWTGVDAQGRPFNAAAQRLAANPAFVSGEPVAGPTAPGGGEDAGWGPTFAQGGPDRVIPSGGAPAATLAQYAPGGGGAPGAGAMPAIPQVPVPPGADAAKMNALILELARRNAASEVLGLGNPYNSLLTVLQGSPQYKAAVEAAIEQARRTVGLPFIQPEAREKALGGYEVDVATRTAQANLDRVTEQIKQLGTAANTLAPNGILVPDGQGGMKRIQATVAQALKSANGLGVPELGIPPMNKAPGGGGVAGAGGATGTAFGEPVYTPGQIKAQEAAATDAQALAQSYRTTADLAVGAKATLQNISGEIGSMVNGPFAPAAQSAASYLRILDPGFNKQVQSYEELYANANELVRKAVRQSDPNPSFIQTQMAFNSMPVPEKSPAGLQQITNRMIGVNDHDIARAAAIPQYKAATGSVDGFDSYWRKNVSPYAFVFAKMNPDDQLALRTKLESTEQGKREIAKLKDQLGFIKQNGLEQ